MTDRAILQDLLEEFHQEINSLGEGVLRDAHFSSMTNKIKVAIGMRRVGKTYFMMQKIQALLKENTSLNQILYLNFEDDRLLPVNQRKLSDLIDDFYSLYPENHEKICYLFLDEIQNVEDWALVIRRMFDTKKVEIYLSGSSAKLLSKEIASSLRGRSMATEIWPYSFHEYLVANHAPMPEKIMGKAARDNMMSWLSRYLNEGGFPESLNLDNTERVKLLQNYVDVVIFRDIIERYKISNVVLVKYMIKTLLKNIGSGFSVNKFFNDVKSQGFAVSKNTLHECLAYIEDAYLAFSVPLYDKSIRKVQSNPRKIYAIDAGLICAYNLSPSANFGHLFENLIYLDLKRQDHEVYYYLTKERYEVDFLSKDKLGKLHLIQVAWDIEDEETMQREERALKAAEKELGIKGHIITPAEYFQEGILK